MAHAAPWNSRIPDTLNGYPVIAYIEHDNGYATVMMDRSEGPNTDLIVATWHPSLTKGWLWGHYDFHSHQDAEKVMREVADRNRSRSR